MHTHNATPTIGNDMKEPEYLAAVNAVVARWLHDHAGEPLTAEAFGRAERAQCHSNADAYVAQHGGLVVRGFLVQHPHDWSIVLVMPHSVVRTATGLVDVTLTNAELESVAFFSIEGDPEGFKEWAKRYPQERRPIVRSQ